jgi:hypothetical protein
MHWPAPEALPAMHGQENTMPISFVALCCVSKDILISAHVTSVQTVTARDQLHKTRQHRYESVGVCPSDVRTCLSEFARAIMKSPLC